MQFSEREVRQLAEEVVRALIEQGFVKFQTPQEQAVDRVFRILRENFRTEREIEEEAEEIARRNASRMVGMDQRKVIQGIKQHLAEQRGFIL